MCNQFLGDAYATLFMNLLDFIVLLQRRRIYYIFGYVLKFYVKVNKYILELPFVPALHKLTFIYLAVEREETVRNYEINAFIEILQ